MDESQNGKAVDLDEELTEVRVNYKGHRVSHFFRSMSPQDAFEYRRRSGKYKIRRGVAEATDEALMAPYWLYDKLCERVEGATIKDAPLMEVPDWKDKVPPLMKEAVVNAYLSRIEQDEADDLGN